MFLCSSVYIFLNRLVIVCFTACLLNSKVKAQVSLFYNETAAALPAGAVFYYTDSSTDISQSHYNSISNALAPYTNNSSSFNYKKNMVWLRLDLAAVPMPTSFSYVMIRNPQINYLRVWLLKNDSVITEFPVTGDRLAFSSRTIKHPDFVFPLPADSLQHYSILILADKRNETLAIPIHLLSEDGFLSFNRNKALLAGFIAGLSLFLFVFNLFLFFQMKERLYVFYGLYILMGFSYIFSDLGYSFMLFFPNNPLPADLMKPLSISLALPLYLLFCIELLTLKKQMPLSRKWMLRSLVVYAAIVLCSSFFLLDTGKTRVLLLVMMQVLLTGLVIGNTIIAIYASTKKIKYSIYIVISSLILLVTTFLYSMFLSGDVTDNLLNRNLMNIGFAGEISLLAFVLSLRFKNYKKQSEELLKKSNLQQEQIFKTVADYQEKELQRLSSLLHDSVGARLSALRFNLEAGIASTNTDGKIKIAIDEVNELAKDVRGFSHSLSPILLQQKGLVEALQHFIRPINEGGKLYIQFEIIGALQRSSFQYELLIYNIIQELIQNIIKHSGATEAIAQLLLEDKLVSIFVEDNGKGFKMEVNKEGLGFSQIKQLVTFVNGSLQIDSAENKGTRISIEFTTITDERKHPDTYS